MIRTFAKQIRRAGWGLYAVGLVIALFVVIKMIDQSRRSRQQQTPTAGQKNEPRASANAPASKAGPKTAPEELAITFADLNFHPPSERKLGRDHNVRFLEEAPEAIRALNGRNVRLSGFMIPIRMENTDVRECVIVPSQLNCCFGRPPRFCQLVVVRMTDKAIPPIVEQLVSFSGTLHVGDVYERGYWYTFYRLDCTGVAF